MSFERIFFVFVVILALTLNFGFFVGEIDNPSHHNEYELFAALVVNVIATVMKFGDRSQLGSTMLATSLAADVQLVAAAIVWGWSSFGGASIPSSAMVSVVSLAGGALVANIVSVVLLLMEASRIGR